MGNYSILMLLLELVFQDDIWLYWLLLPKQWNTASKTYMWKHKIMTDKNLFSLHKVRTVKVIIQSPMVKPCAWHFFRPATDYGIIERKVIIFTIYFPHMSLDNLNHKRLTHLILHKHAQHWFIPPELFLCRLLVEILRSC